MNKRQRKKAAKKADGCRRSISVVAKEIFKLWSDSRAHEDSADRKKKQKAIKKRCE